MTSTRRRELAAIFGLFILIALAYHNEPNNAFVLDDMPNILEVSSVHITDLSLENLYIAGKEGLHPRRILPNISFAIDWWRGNGSPRSFLWTNLIIHITNGMLVFLLIRLILRRIGQSDNYILISAFVGAALWALHPIQVQSVTYIVQRMASMATLFMLLSVFGYLYARLEARSKLPWFVISGISFFLGMLSKENAVITPLLILLAEYGVCRNHSDLIRSRIDVWFLLFPLLILFYVVIDLASGAGPLTPFVQKGYTTRDFTLAERLLTQPRVIMFHFSQLLWPLPDRFSIEHDFTLSRSLLNPLSTLFSIVVLLVWIGGGVWAFLTREWRTVGFLMLWIPVGLAIESSIFSLEMVFEHRMYFPTVGLFALLALGIHKLLVSGKFPVWSVAGSFSVVIGLLMISTMIRIPQWQSTLTLYKQAVLNAPHSHRANYNYANALLDRHDYAKAVDYYEKALSIKPDLASIHNNLGTALLELGEYEKAEKHFREALRLKPDHLLARFQLGHLLAMQGDSKTALDELTNLLTRYPDFEPGHNAIGYIYDKLSRPAEAISHYREALRLNSDDKQTYINLGISLAKMGKPTEAAKYFLQGIKLDPNNADLYNNLGIAYYDQGNYAQAEYYFKQALKIDPSYRQAIDNLNRLEQKK